MVNPITTQFIEYFQSKGMKLVEKTKSENEEDKNTPDLIMSDNTNRIYLKIIQRESLNERNELLSSIMKSVSYLFEANIVYLALPKLYASILDGKVFRENGLGLLIYDDKGALEEVIRPKIFPNKQMSTSSSSTIPIKLMDEINSLKDSLHSLEIEVNMLKDLVNNLKNNQKSIEIEPQIKKVKVEQKVNSTDFPEFMRDNPWVEILSRRGRG
ncbi:MAG: hypothetical protein NWF08_09850 [Candidatus Bathyarchaeota archaeon]|nr:hypothetical protein [Candidatus Bathyarchaeota archaeon]